MARPESSTSLGPLESAVLGILWNKEDMSVREVQASLEEAGSALAYTTVMTVLVRLAAKGFVTRLKSGKQFRYSAAIGEIALGEKIARSLAAILAGPHGSLAIASFIEELARVSPERLSELRRLADAAPSP